MWSFLEEYPTNDAAANDEDTEIFLDEDPDSLMKIKHQRWIIQLPLEVD